MRQPTRVHLLVLLLLCAAGALPSQEVTTVVQTDEWTGELYQVVGQDYAEDAGLSQAWMIFHRSVTQAGTASHLWSIELPGQRPGGRLSYRIGEGDPVPVYSDTYQFTWVEPITTVHWFLFGHDDATSLAYGEAEIRFTYTDAVGEFDVVLSREFRAAVRAALEGTLETNVPEE